MLEMLLASNLNFATTEVGFSRWIPGFHAFETPMSALGFAFSSAMHEIMVLLPSHPGPPALDLVVDCALGEPWLVHCKSSSESSRIGKD